MPIALLKYAFHMHEKILSAGSIIHPYPESGLVEGEDSGHLIDCLIQAWEVYLPMLDSCRFLFKYAL